MEDAKLVYLLSCVGGLDVMLFRIGLGARVSGVMSAVIIAGGVACVIVAAAAVWLRVTTPVLD